MKCKSKRIPVYTKRILRSEKVSDSTYSIRIFVRFDVDLVPA
jgi:hypothetical protein